jgi:hypothetical protein
MHLLTTKNPHSMVALHLPTLAVGQYAEALSNTGFKYVKTPIRIGPPKATGYSTTWSHMPIANSQSFYLFKQNEAAHPTHNAFRMLAMNPASNYRSYWCETQIIPSSEYAKSKEEIRRHVSARLVFVCARLSISMYTLHTCPCTRSRLSAKE